MKREDVSKIFKDATEEQISALLDINTADIGKAKGDYNSLKTQFEALKTEKTNLETKISELETANGNAEKYKKDLEALQQQIADEKAEVERKAREAAIEAEYKTRFNNLVGENKWRDELTGNAVYSEFKKAVSDEANKGKGDKEIFELLTKDKNYYENPNKPADMVGMGDVSAGNISDNNIRAVMGLPPVK